MKKNAYTQYPIIMKFFDIQTLFTIFYCSFYT